MKDPGSFTIPCSIGGIHIGKALCDLGASINLMPLSVFNKLGIASQPTTVTLQLADRSVVHPEGRIEDVLVKVDKFILPTDFIILDYEADEDVPIILGRPFLSTGRTLIDVHKGEIIMRVNDQEVIFNVFKALEYPGEQETCQNLDAEDEFHGMLLEENDETIANLDAQQPEQCCASVHSTFETLIPNQINQRTKPSLEEAPEIELKVLPAHLKYAYLGEGNSLPVIISATLSPNQESALLFILKKHIRAVGWTLADIKGISPTYCMHKIRLEEGKDGSIEAQRRLNPAMKEVVKKEVLKWLFPSLIVNG
uniref:retropepsin-like aspartic protease n=1 Tax=Picosynechococcus sp. (strain ATCC 27264 / PCC 7002 / PR-6) TaxID=32049 RepID=UPI001C3E3B63